MNLPTKRDSKADVSSVSPSSERMSFNAFDERLTLETSAFRISLRWPIHIINLVDKTLLISLNHLSSPSNKRTVNFDG